MLPHHTGANECCQLADHAASGLSQGRSRITERSPVTGFSQTSSTFMGLRSGAPFGSRCDIRAQVSHRGRLVGNSSQIR